MRCFLPLLLCICLAVHGCGYRRQCQPASEPNVLRIALDINDDKDLEVMAKLYGKPPLLDMKDNVFAYRATYDVHDDAILELLSFDFRPTDREVWWLVVHYDREDGQAGKFETFMARCEKVLEYDHDKQTNVWKGQFRTPTCTAYADVTAACRAQPVEQIAAALSSVK